MTQNLYANAVVMPQNDAKESIKSQTKCGGTLECRSFLSSHDKMIQNKS